MQLHQALFSACFACLLVLLQVQQSSAFGTLTIAAVPAAGTNQLTNQS